jgi:transposase
LCKQCGATFIKKYQSNAWQKRLFQEYVFGKQTLKQLADKYGGTKKTIQKYLDQYESVQSNVLASGPVVIGLDCTFFGRGNGIIVARCPNLKKNLYCKEIITENRAVYEEARRYLEGAGFNIQAVVLDAKHGIREVFSGLVVQICQYHQQQIVVRYLTTKPKTEAGLELRVITSALTELEEISFTELLDVWYKKWSVFLKERTYKPDRKHWSYTHRRIRAAYRSLITNLPYLFSYQKYPDLKIPNTNNSSEGSFSELKRLLNNHHGLKRWRRYRITETILNR